MDLPDFQPGKCYALFGSTLNDMVRHFHENRPCGTEGGGVNVDAVTFDGTFLSADPGNGGGGGNDDGLEFFDENKTYFLKENTIKKFFGIAKINHTRATEGGGLMIPIETDDGLFVAQVP